MSEKFRLGFLVVGIIAFNCCRATTYSPSDGTGSFGFGGVRPAAYVTTNLSLNNGSVVRGYVASRGFGTGGGTSSLSLYMIGRMNGFFSADVSTTPLINLYEDLECGSGVFFQPNSKYRIAGNGHSVRLAGPLTFTSSALFYPSGSSLIIDGGGNTLKLASSQSLKIDTSTSLTLRNMTLLIQSTGALYPLATSSQLTLDNVNVVLAGGAGTYLFDQGALGYGQLFIMNNVTIAGIGAAQQIVFSYNANQSLTILAGGQLTIGDGIIFRYAPQTITNNNLIHFTNSTSKLKFDNATLQTTSGSGNGLKILGGMVIFDNLCYLENTSAGDGTGSSGSAADGGIIFGDGTTSGNDVDVRLLAGATVVVNGYLQYNHS